VCGGLHHVPHVATHRRRTAALVALIVCGGVARGLRKRGESAVVHLEDRRGEIALPRLRPLKGLLGEAVVSASEAVFEATEEQRVPCAQPHATLERGMDGGLRLLARSVKEVFLERDGTPSQPDLALEVPAIGVEPCAEVIGHARDARAEVGVCPVGEPLCGESQVRTHGSIGRSIRPRVSRVLLAQERAQPLWVRLHPGEGCAGVERAGGRIGHVGEGSCCHTAAVPRSAPVALAAFRRTVADNYAEVRRTGVGAAAWRAWRVRRDALFRAHPQSPVPPPLRSRFTGMPFHPYDPTWRLLGRVQEAHADAPVADDAMAGAGAAFCRIGVVVATRDGRDIRLPLLWLEGYGGGLFLPFRDGTNGGATYGGGRYLLDQAKGADLGATPDGLLVLDFNFAYHPSCAHDPRWACPLAPSDAVIGQAVRAGELRPAGTPEGAVPQS
jgi:uncharacterized protein